MKQEAYNTRQRAEELLSETISIWRQGDHSDQLEGLEHDPVFSLLITALAWQANETDSEIERLRQDVLDEFARLLVPYEVGHAIPATAVVEAALQDTVAEAVLNEKSIFALKDSNHLFMPLLQSRVFNATVRSIIRLDGRRWKLTLLFRDPVSDLSGMTFAIRDSRFRDVKVTMNGMLLPLVKPWDYADMPLQRCFSLTTLLYNRRQMYQAAMTGLDLYARQNVALFCVAKSTCKPLMPMESELVELEFDFTGISDDFVFDKSHFSLNAILLVNAQLNTASLSATTPLVKVAGGSDNDTKEGQGPQLMHLIPPAQEQLFGKTPVEVRRVAADRFNQGALTRLVNSLVTKFSSDYYAFLHLKDNNLSAVARDLQEALAKLSRAASQEPWRNIGGVYLVIQPTAFGSDAAFSLDIDYLTTEGSLVNESLKADSSFVPPPGFDAAATKQIAKPAGGFNEVSNAEAIPAMLSYFMTSSDRIVTPADIKLFCYTTLMSRYSISNTMVSSITVQQQQDRSDCGYGIYVDICLQDSNFIRRSFTDKIAHAEMLLQKMMEVRSTGVYPIYVNIQIEEKKQ
jgi:hypothetical protein